MHRIISILLLLSGLSVFGQGKDGFSVTGTNIVSSAVSPWFLREAGFSSDQPEGGWFCYSSPGVTNATFVVTLPQTLDAGVWRLQYKSLVYDNAEFDPKSQRGVFTIADGSNSALISDRGDSRRWLSSGINITNSYATNKLSMSFNTLTNADIQFWITAIYLTTNLNEDIAIDGSDLVWDFTYPSGPVSTNLDNTVNLIGTSSFETSIGGWFLSAQANRTNALVDYRVSGDASHGTWALKSLNATETLQAPTFSVKPDGRNYTVSAAWKGTNATVRVRANVNIPTGFTAAVNEVKALPNSSSWQTTNFSVALVDYPVGAPYVVEVTGAVGSLFDSISVVEGTNAVAFATQNGWELGWSNSVPSGVYYSGDPEQMHLVIHNTGGSTRTTDIAYEFVNHAGAVVAGGAVAQSMANNSYHSAAITLPGEGWYRAIAYGSGITPRETIVSVIADPGTSRSRFALTHNFSRLWQVQGTERLGIRGSRLLSPNAFLRVTISEPTEGNYVWDDASITNYEDNNTDVIGVFGTSGGGTDFPSYMASDTTWVTLDLAKWTRHASNLFKHYEPLGLRYVEIMNEPSGGSVPWTAAAYTNMAGLTINAIRAFSTNAIFLVGGGVADTNFLQVCVNAFGTADPKIFYSMHLYPYESEPYAGGPALGGANYWRQFIASNPGIQLWNTESGPQDYATLLAHSRYVLVGSGIYDHQHLKLATLGMAGAPSLMLQTAVANAGAGIKRLAHYDSRSTFTGLEQSWASSFDLDDGHRPRFAGLGTLNNIVDGRTPAWVLPTSNTNLVAMYFDAGTNSRAALWSYNSAPFRVTSTNVAPFDYMLTSKAVVTNTYTVGRIPIYLFPAGGITSDQFKSHITNSSLALPGDMDPPALLIYEFPGKTITDTNRVEFRWAGWDEYDVPGPNSQRSVLFRHKLSVNASGYAADTYSDWETDLRTAFLSVSDPAAQFTVQAKDAAGNTTTQTRTFGSEAATTPAAKISGSAQLNGSVRINGTP